VLKARTRRASRPLTVRKGAALAALCRFRSQTGPYRMVRHPIYTGGIALAYGWALVVQGWLALLYASLILILLDRKSKREEQWLAERFPEYRDYQRRVHKLIPFVY
ncbi:MAG: isoprenylcysteine carboxylmethyltransferase family protein, partial [Acidobacteriota bacterium]